MSSAMRRDLRLGAGEAPQLEILQLVVGEDRRRHAVLGIAPDRHGPARSVSGPLCLTRPSSVSQVRLSPSKSAIAALERGDDAQRLRVVVEAAEAREAVVERALAGMAERRMAEIVRQRQRLGEVLVEAERARQRAGDLGDLERMGEPGAVMVALVEDEDLRLVREPAEGGRMDDAVAVAAEVVAGRARRLRHSSRPRLCAGSAA